MEQKKAKRETAGRRTMEPVINKTMTLNEKRKLLADKAGIKVEIDTPLILED